MRSTWVTHAGQRPKNSKPFCGTRYQNSMLKPYLGTVPPCGVFCGGCPTFTREKNPCPGAEISQRCKNIGCGYFICCAEKNIDFCHGCDQYPCRRFKTFARNWQKYGQDFLENQLLLKEKGTDCFLQYWNEKAHERENKG